MYVNILRTCALRFFDPSKLKEKKVKKLNRIK